ncbi:MAG: Rid family hydrolase [Candidatus Palauibacterales bacterium]|nr:Rid family hydrolase [Candidatus Palauibacterales bacterium]
MTAPDRRHGIAGFLHCAEAGAAAGLLAATLSNRYRIERELGHIRPPLPGRHPMLRRATGVLLAALAILSVAPHALQAQQRQYIAPRAATDTTTLPFSGGVLVGNTLYLSGTIGLLPDQTVPATATEEARRVLDNIKEALTRAGMTMDDLVQVQVFCSDLSTYAEFNKVYRTYFTKVYPPRAFIGVAHVLFDARYEVQGIAVKG